MAASIFSVAARSAGPRSIKPRGSLAARLRRRFFRVIHVQKPCRCRRNAEPAAVIGSLPGSFYGRSRGGARETTRCGAASSLPLEGPLFASHMRGAGEDPRNPREKTMSPEERQLLTGLFDRIRGAAATPRDPEAEALISDAVRNHALCALSAGAGRHRSGPGAAGRQWQDPGARSPAARHGKPAAEPRHRRLSGWPRLDFRCRQPAPGAAAPARSLGPATATAFLSAALRAPAAVRRPLGRRSRHGAGMGEEWAAA